MEKWDILIMFAVRQPSFYVLAGIIRVGTDFESACDEIPYLRMTDDCYPLFGHDCADRTDHNDFEDQ